MRRSMAAALVGLVVGALSTLAACPSLSEIGVEAAEDATADHARVPPPADVAVDAGQDTAAKDAARDAPCLVDVASDPHNCGACGHDCLGGGCLGGTCEAVVLFQGDTPSGIAVDGPDLFITTYTADPNEGYVFRCATSDCQGTKVVLATGLVEPWFPVQTGGTAFWTNSGDEDADIVTSSGSVMSCPVEGCPDAGPMVYTGDGGGEEGGANFAGLALDSTYLYWAELLNFGAPATGRISRCATTACASTIVHLASGSESLPYAVAVDPSYVYWTDLGTMQVDRCSLPSCGGNPEIFAPNQAFPTGIAIYGGNVYWTQNSSPGSVLFCPTAGCGTEPTTVAAGQASPYAVAVDDSGVYWTNVDDGTVMRCPLAGCKSPTFLAAAPAAFAIALDAVSVYFTSSTLDGKVLRVAK